MYLRQDPQEEKKGLGMAKKIESVGSRWIYKQSVKKLHFILINEFSISNWC